MSRRISWFGKSFEPIPGVTHHSTGEATCPRFLSRKDGLVHLQNPDVKIALGCCGVRYNVYRRSGMRGHKGIPTDAPVTCMTCLAEEEA